MEHSVVREGATGVVCGQPHRVTGPTVYKVTDCVVATCMADMGLL